VASYAASRAARAGYQARLTKLEFEQKSGKLVDADEVRAQLFALGRRVRDSLLGVPDRLAPILAGETDPAVVHRLLSEEIERGLAELSTAPPMT
jgi:phage terminase Nu1 subunit (DNA packaging protein)